MLLVSPERLNNPGFRDEVLPRLAATCGLLVVDEAHCISDWGHDFRPDYRRIRTLLAELPDGIPVLATTATANARVTDDVAEQLGTDVLVLRGSLDRESLRLGVVRLKTAEQRLAWLADHLAEQPGLGHRLLPDRRGHPGDRRLPALARARRGGLLRADRAHRAAGPRAGPRRRPGQGAGRDQRARAWASTPRLGFVVNLGAPPSPVAYYQQVGRAGRGTDRGHGRAAARRSRTATSGPTSPPWPSRARSRCARPSTCCRGRARPMSTAALETYVELNRNRLETMLKVLDVDGAVRRVRGGWEATGRRGPTTRSATPASPRPASASSGRCSTTSTPTRAGCASCASSSTTRRRPTAGAATTAVASRCRPRSPTTPLEEAGARLARPGVVVEPRKMWPTALANLGLDLKGKITDGAEPGPRGRPAHRPRPRPGAARAVPRRRPPDGAVPEPLVRAVVEVLRRLASRTSRASSSSSRPPARTLVDDLADGLSRFLQAAGGGPLGDRRPGVEPGRGAMNSAQRVAAVGAPLRPRGRRARRGPVLLVDDRVVTGWTLTLAARALRRAGATEVLPLVLASAG